MIVNADDLGLSAGVNAGVFEAHEHGIVTSASLMALRPGAGAAAEEARRHPDLAIGLHLDLDDVGRDEKALDRACRDQLDAFRVLMGIDPTHLDSHHHAHMNEPVSAIAGLLADDLGVPLRARGIRYEHRFFGQVEGRSAPERVSVEHLISLIEALPAGWTELGCHPGRGVGEETSYAGERELELQTLCDRDVAAAIVAGGVELRSFADVRSVDRSLPPRGALDSGGDGGR